MVYEYVLLYTDDCLVVSYNAESIPKKEIGKYFQLKTAMYLSGLTFQILRLDSFTKTRIIIKMKQIHWHLSLA